MTAGPNSAERILAILDLFDEGRLDWRPEEMMQRLGYARPTLYRYLRTLRDAGFLVSQPGGAWSLGPKVVELDFLMRKADPLIRAGRGELHAIVADWTGAALLVRWYGQRLLCVASECAEGAPVTSYPRGRPMPLAKGAISRAILAYLPKGQQAAIAAENRAAFAEVGMPDEAAVLDALRMVRRDGVAVARGEVTPGVLGVAAPVFDEGRQPVAALCLTTDQRQNEPRLEDIKDEVRCRAGRIGRCLVGEKDRETP